MEHKLMWGALGLSALGWVALFLLSLSRRAAPTTASQSREFFPVRRGFFFLSLGLPVLIWLLTLPVKAPFSSGQGFGRGFLWGGLLAFLSAMMMNALLRRSSNPRAAATIPLFGAIIAASVPLLWMRATVIDALLGAALGWLAVSLIWLLGLDWPARAHSIDESNSSPNWPAILILNGAAFAAMLLGVAALGVYRDFVVATVARGTHSAVALALAASVAVVFLVDALLGAMMSGDSTPHQKVATRSSLLPLGLALVAPLGVGYLLATKVFNDPTLIYVIVAGVVLGALLWILVRADALQNGGLSNARVPFAATLVALCGFMLSYGLMQGFGVGVMLLCAWPATLLALPTSVASDSTTVEEVELAKFEIAQTLSLLASFGAILLFSRLFATRFRADLRGANFDDQFALFGFVAGAMVPSLLSSLWFDTKRTFHSSLPRLFFVGIVALAIAGAMLAVWGAKVVPAFLVGLALAAVGFVPNFLSRIAASATALFALCLAVAVTQWTQRFLPLAELTRAQRLHFLWWSLGAIVVLLLFLDYGSRLLDWAKNRNTPQFPSPDAPNTAAQSEVSQ